MNSRLLHAAARGARLQSQYHNWETGGREWREASLNQLYGARIHPDDEHLAYGPVSTALRGHAVEPPLSLDVAFPVLTYFCANANYSEWSIFKECHSELHRSLFLLILAEALADEGL